MDRRTQLSALVTVLAAGWGVWRAQSETWVCDDAFISFRYARNLVEGHGLVFNVGENVEGYTNFLWTLIVAAGMAVGLDPVAFSAVAGIAAYAGLIALLGLRRGGAWPIAALGVALHYHLQLYATSGLETMLFTLLVTASVLQAGRAETRNGWLGVGVLGALATLTRPEGAAVLLLCALSGRKKGAWALASSAAIGLPWVLWKLSFYGELLPNTWYAKGGSDWAYGLYYLKLYTQAYWPVMLGFVAAAVAAWRTRERLPLLILAVAGVLVLHIARVGDFMFTRFCLPFTPLLLVALEEALPKRLGPLWMALLGTAIVMSPYPDEVRSTGDQPEGLRGVVEEKDWYPERWVLEAERQGRVLAEKTEGLDLHAAYYGTQAMLVYHGRVKALEAHVGLTDYEVARMRPQEDARAGHGQKTNVGYLRSRGVDVIFNYRLQQNVNDLEVIDFGDGITGRLVVWRPELLVPLSERGVQVVNVPGYIDGYIAILDSFSDEQVEADFAFFEKFYFSVADDPERRQPFLDRLGR